MGGLDKHIQALKEMVVLPLLYPDVFQRFDTQVRDCYLAPLGALSRPPI